MLRLVKPEGPKPPKRKWQRAAPALTAEQQAKARAALKNLRMAFGTWECLGVAMGGVCGNKLAGIASGKRTMSVEMLVRACLAGGLSVDAMLEAKLTSSGRCTSCGALRRVS